MGGFKKAIIFILCVLAITGFSGCAVPGGFSAGRTQTAAGYKEFNREIKDVDFSGVSFTPWNVAAAAANVRSREKKPYTIMIYMNGSDLESNGGAATKDLIEMLESGLNQKNANLVIFTGGTNRWQNNLVPSYTCGLWEITDGFFQKITSVGLVNMGDAGTLSSFIDFGLTAFPADKYGLVFWDHGGGSIAGFGHDEKFNSGTLSLLEMNYAFEKSLLTRQPLEFLGFDSCLMASVEMGVVASDYARFLIASEDLEPGDGWDYGFLSELNRDPGQDGAQLGKAAADYFMAFYGSAQEYDLTLSVTDLTSIKNLMGSMGKLMSLCAADLTQQPSAAFKQLAQKRNGTKTFGIGSPRDNESDMVDVGEMARQLSDLYPEQAQAVLSGLGGAVVYQRHNSSLALGGLSAYYIYGGKRTANESLGVYASLKMDQPETDYMHYFSDRLNSGYFSFSTGRAAGQGGDAVKTQLTMWRGNGNGQIIMTGMKDEGDQSPLWPRINGQNVCFYPVSGSQNRRLYAVPARVNGSDADIIVAVNAAYPTGKILGARKEDGFIIQKGYDEIKPGDKISFYYPVKSFDGKNFIDTGWQPGEETEISGALMLDWAEPDAREIFYSARYTDYMQNEKFINLKTAA